MNPTKYLRVPICKKGGFTLIELIMVIAIIVILISLTVPALISTSAGRDLDKAVDTAQTLASAARQQAISKGTMVALLLSGTSSASLNNSQEFMLLQASINSSGTATWSASSQWVRVPTDVLLTPLARNNTYSFYAINSAAPASAGNSWVTSSLSSSFPATVGTQTLTSTNSAYSYIVFNSDGSVSAPTSGPAINLQRNIPSVTTPDYMVLIPEASGRAKVNAMH